ncbi:MAG: hypothetical protein HC815_32260, partial [Richelia sp. RM1_1_1]|nr:hypothetical protein [Richelia sp. RM1_1_1]
MSRFSEALGAAQESSQKSKTAQESSETSGYSETQSSKKSATQNPKLHKKVARHLGTQQP